MRLYMIVVQAPAIFFDDVLSALTSRHGPAASAKRFKTKSKSGWEYDNQIVGWDDKDTLLMIERHGDDISTMNIGYQDQKLSEAVDRAVAPAAGALRPRRPASPAGRP